jgi:SAM-dependent methyltransferase
VIGIDPSLGALLAAKRAFSGLDLDIAWVCGDARFLPFKNELFRCAFSYSVLQHLSENDAGCCIAELGRVLREGGFAKIQMAHKGGLRSTYWRSHRNYMNGGPFRVRYWSLKSMRDAFESKIGPTTLIAEAFGGLGLLAEDRDYVSTQAKALISISTLLKKLSIFLRPLVRLADSVYIVATKR